MLHDYLGAIHVHSVHSDGSGTVAEIVGAAREAHLDFLILTDHSNREFHQNGWQGWHDRLLLIVGAEVGSPRLRHYIVMGVEDVTALRTMSLEKGLESVRTAGGRTFVAHPLGTKVIGMSMPPWTAWDSPHFTGIEVWSYMHDWIEDFRWRRLRSFYRDPHGKITGPHEKALEAWDRVAQLRPVSGIAGLDAHAKPLAWRWMKFFPYDMLFGTTLTHVLVEEFTGEAKSDVNKVLEALAQGRCYMAYHVLGDPRGFRFSARTASHEVAMGGEVSLHDSPVLTVTLPMTGEIRCVAAGKELGGVRGTQAAFRAQAAGAHRVEVRRNGRPWIFSNHIYVR